MESAKGERRSKGAGKRQMIRQMDAGNEVVEDDNDDALSLTARERVLTAGGNQHPFATSQDDQQPLSSIRHRATDPNSLNGGEEGRKSSKMQQPREAHGLLMGGQPDFGEDSGNENDYAISSDRQ